MATSHDELITQVMEAQQFLARAVSTLAEPTWVALDLTITQLKSLMVLASSGSMPIHRLAGMLHLQRSATSTLVDQLVRVDLLTRTEDPADRRRTLVDLTVNGRALLTNLRQGRKEKMRALLGKFPDEDLVALARIVSTLAQFVIDAVAAERPETNSPSDG